jgi:chlorobactene glucosyltransferase
MAEFRRSSGASRRAMQTVTLAVLVLWLMALVRTVVNLAAVPRLRARPDLPHTGPLVSVLVPARDEARTIERTARALLAQSYTNLEVIVLDDRSEDGTGEILARIAAEDARLHARKGDELPVGWMGKPWALHQASTQARGELLLFVDADVIYAPDTIAAAVERIERSRAAMLTLFPDFEMKSLGEHAVLPMLAVTAFSILPLWLSNRTRIPTIALGGGPGNLVRRSAYDTAGGHVALRDAVIDDVALARLVRRAGFATETARAEELVSVRMYHGFSEVMEGFTKNAYSAFGNSLIVALFLLAGMIVFHLGPFLTAALGDRIGLITVAVILTTRVILFSALRYPLWNALLLQPLMTLLWSWIVLRSIWFTGFRRQLRWRGRTYDAAHTRFGAD